MTTRKIANGKRLCSVNRCGGKLFGRYYCEKHYRRLYRHGQLFTQRELFQHAAPLNAIALTRGKYAFVDPEDFDRVMQYNWRAAKGANGTWYAQRSYDRLPMQSFVLGIQGMADHRDGNGLNNRRANLRPCTRPENARNKRKCRGISKYKGVWRDRKKRLWCSQIGHNKKCLFLGYFKDEIDAAIVYDVAAQIFHKDFASLNNPI